MFIAERIFSAPLQSGFGKIHGRTNGGYYVFASLIQVIV